MYPLQGVFIKFLCSRFSPAFGETGDTLVCCLFGQSAIDNKQSGIPEKVCLLPIVNGQKVSVIYDEPGISRTYLYTFTIPDPLVSDGSGFKNTKKQSNVAG
jgi:hypothetical protein